MKSPAQLRVLADRKNAWVAKNREHVNATKRAWCRKNSDRKKAHMLKTLYGLSWEDYTTMLTQQGGKCLFPSCENDAFAVDHDHTTKAVRGLLCRTCNSGIGMLKENISLMRDAIRYLEIHSCRQQ